MVVWFVTDGPFLSPLFSLFFSENYNLAPLLRPISVAVARVSNGSLVCH